MDITKTAVLTFATIVAGLILLLIPDSYRDETVIGEKPLSRPVLREKTPHQAIAEFAPAQPASSEVVTSSPEKPESPAHLPTTTPLTEWPTLLYPELARIAELEHQSADTALSELIPMLASDDPAIRFAAIESLGDMTSPTALTILTMALNDPSSQLRVAALEALVSHDNQSVASSIESYLFDEEQEVRIAAIEALSDLESDISVHALASLLSDQDSRIRLHAVYALGEIGGDNAVRYLRQARYDPIEIIRANADTILAELEYEAAY